MISRRTIKPISTDKTQVFSYTHPEVLSKFVTEQGAILPRTRTGLTQKQQRRLARAIKQARHLAMLPFTQTL